MRAQRRRLDQLAHAIAVRPLPRDAVETAFQRFRESGELPLHQRLAREVVQHTIARTPKGEFDLLEGFRRAAALASLIEAGEELPPDPPDLRSHLLLEALHENEMVWRPARLVLQILVSGGGDVLDPEFVPSDLPPPEFGTVGLHLLGWPEFVVVPPYEEQARRLLDRLATLRACVGSRDDAWYAIAATAAAEFLQCGALPDDELLRDFVLADAELLALTANCCGRGDAEVLACFDRVATTTGTDRERALAELQELGRTGRFRA